MANSLVTLLAIKQKVNVIIMYLTESLSEEIWILYDTKKTTVEFCKPADLVVSSFTSFMAQFHHNAD